MTSRSADSTDTKTMEKSTSITSGTGSTKQRHEQIDGAYLLGLLVMGLSGFVIGFLLGLPL